MLKYYKRCKKNNNLLIIKNLKFNLFILQKKRNLNKKSEKFSSKKLIKESLFLFLTINAYYFYSLFIVKNIKLNIAYYGEYLIINNY